MRIVLRKQRYWPAADGSFPLTVEDMDLVADLHFTRMATHPEIGLTVTLSHLRDREGFYSIEVVQDALEQNGFSLTFISMADLGDIPDQDVISIHFHHF